MMRKPDILKETKFDRGAKQDILRTYAKLHEHKIGMHWLWAAIERIVAGEPEKEVMEDFGYIMEQHLDKKPTVRP